MVKADGLAAGKGVIVAASTDEACSAVDDMLVNKAFGSAGQWAQYHDCLLLNATLHLQRNVMAL